MLDAIIFSFILFLLIAVGSYRSKKIRSASTYLFAEKKTSFISLTATLVMTEFNSATLISFSSLGYGAGLWALCLPLIFLIGLLFYAFAAAKKWKEYDGASVAGFFSERYGKDVGLLAGIFLMVAMLGFSAAYMKSLTVIFQPLFLHLNAWALSGFLLLAVLMMCLRGGLVAIIRTDLLSLGLLLLFLPSLAIYMGTTAPIPDITQTLSAGRQALPLQFVSSLIILTMFTYILAPWYGQKIFAAKNSKIAFRSVIAAAVLVFFLYGSAIFAAAFYKFRGYSVASWEGALPAILNDCLPGGFKGFGYALLFATSATTLTGVWSAMAGMVASGTTGFRKSLYATLFFALCSYLLANTLIDKIFEKMILANIPVAALSFALLAGFHWQKSSRAGAYFSIFTGLLCGTCAYGYFGEAGGYTWYWAVYGIPLIFISGIAGSLLFSNKKLNLIDL